MAHSGCRTTYTGPVCYWIHISATKELDLDQFEEVPYTLAQLDNDPEPGSLPSLLRYPYKYMLGIGGACGCDLRRQAMDFACNVDGSDGRYVPPLEGFHFAPPEEDEADMVPATTAAYDLFSALVADGVQVDLVDGW